MKQRSALQWILFILAILIVVGVILLALYNLVMFIVKGTL